MRSIGKRLSRGTDNLRTENLQKCSTRRGRDNFVVIDLDSEFPDVTIIDVPESLKKKLRTTSLPTVIEIDADDDEVAGGVCSDDYDDSATSNTKPHIAKEKDKNHSFVSKRNSPVNLSKRRKTYPGKPGSRYQFGIGTSDSSDCECIDGPAEKIRKQWELASHRRKSTIPHSIRSGENGAEKSYVSDHDKRKCEEKSFPFAEPECDFEDSLNKDDKHSDDFACSSPNIGDAMGTEPVSMENGSPKDAKKPHNEDFGQCFSSSAQEPVMGTTELDDKSSSPFVDLETMIGSEPCFYNRQPSFDEQFDYFDSDMSEPLKKDPFVLKPHVLVGDHSKCDEFGSIDANEVSMEGKIADHCQKTEFVSLHNHHSSVLMEDDGFPCDLSNGLAFDNTNDVLQDLGGKSGQTDTIFDRQSMKETNEYKRAMEEEWTARQQQLQIQAEEAQRLRKLRKRKRAESMRSMDVERRQKQRLEEVRETQRRDQANLNMKDQLRIKIIKELNLIEKSCKDMASLLQRLGLVVNDGSKLEVQVAYKRALLKFHPDRASRTDIRQQVEAEEKFKLISRMKAKFPVA